MQAYANTGIQYSEEFFDQDMMDWLLQDENIPLTTSNEEELLLDMPLSEGDTTTAFNEAWADMLQDDSFKLLCEEHGYTAEQGLKDFESKVQEPLGNDADSLTRTALQLNYEVKSEADRFVHLIDNEEVLVVPNTLLGANKSSNNAEAKMYIVFMVIDALLIIAAVASIRIQVTKGRLSKTLKGPLKGFFQKLFNPKVVKQLKNYERAEKWVKIIQLLLVALRGRTSIKEVLGKFFDSMSKWDKGIAVLGFLASIALALSTGGGSMAAKIVQLVSACIMLGADTRGYVQATG